MNGIMESFSSVSLPALDTLCSSAAAEPAFCFLRWNDATRRSSVLTLSSIASWKRGPSPVEATFWWATSQRSPWRHNPSTMLFAGGALCRVPDVRRAFSGLFDVLKDGGDLVVSEPIGDSRLVRFLKTVVKRRTTKHYKFGEWKYTSQEWIHMAQGAGFQTVRWFNLGYVALPLLGYPDESHVMRYTPFRMPLARLLLRVDGVIAKIPWINTHSWHAVLHFKKPGSPGSS